MKNKYGFISTVAGAVSIFTLTFIMGIASIVVAFLGLRTVTEGSTSEEDRKMLYLCIAGLALSIVAFLLHSYVF